MPAFRILFYRSPYLKNLIRICTFILPLFFNTSAIAQEPNTAKTYITTQARFITKNIDQLEKDLRTTIADAPTVYALLLLALDNFSDRTLSAYTLESKFKYGDELQKLENFFESKLLVNPSTRRIEVYLDERSSVLDLLDPKHETAETIDITRCARQPVFCGATIDTAIDALNKYLAKKRQCAITREQWKERVEICELQLTNTEAQNEACIEAARLKRELILRGCNLFEIVSIDKYMEKNERQLQRDLAVTINRAPTVYALLLLTVREKVTNLTSISQTQTLDLDSLGMKTKKHSVGTSLFTRPTTSNIKLFLSERKKAISEVAKVNLQLDLTSLAICVKNPVFCEIDKFTETIDRFKKCNKLEDQIKITTTNCRNGNRTACKSLDSLYDIYRLSGCR